MISRMLAMLTDMRLVPHSHFDMPGRIQKHTLAYTIVLAMLLWIKANSDMLVTWASLAGLVLIVVGERVFLRHGAGTDADDAPEQNKD